LVPAFGAQETHVKEGSGEAPFVPEGIRTNPRSLSDLKGKKRRYLFRRWSAMNLEGRKINWNTQSRGGQTKKRRKRKMKMEVAIGETITGRD